MPVLYQPKFCCHCGEAIERVEWTLLTSRRFCTVCASVQKHYDLVPRAVLAAGLIGGLFGMSGFVTRQSDERSQPPQIVSAKPALSVAKQLSVAPSTASSDRPSTTPAKPNDQSPLTNQGRPAPIQNKVKADESEAVYFCGAATKKGTPCSRRVKTPGRCWQHVGQPSMVANTKVAPSK